MSSASGYIGAKYFAAFAPLHSLLLCCMSLGTRETCSSHDPLVAILLKCKEFQWLVTVEVNCKVNARTQILEELRCLWFSADLFNNWRMGTYENSNMPAVSWSALRVTRKTASDKLNTKEKAILICPMLTSTIQAPGQRNHAQHKKPSAASKMQKAERLANAELIFAPHVICMLWAL